MDRAPELPPNARCSPKRIELEGKKCQCRCEDSKQDTHPEPCCVANHHTTTPAQANGRMITEPQKKIPCPPVEYE